MIAKLKAIGALENGKVLSAAVRYAMDPVKKTAQYLAPVSKRPHQVYTGETVDPGYGKKHLKIVVKYDRTNMAATALLGPSKRAYYMTQFVERGTLHAAPHPFIVPALYSNMDNVQQRMTELLRSYLERRASQP